MRNPSKGRDYMHGRNQRMIDEEVNLEIHWPAFSIHVQLLRSDDQKRRGFPTLFPTVVEEEGYLFLFCFCMWTWCGSGTPLNKWHIGVGPPMTKYTSRVLGRILGWWGHLLKLGGASYRLSFKVAGFFWKRNISQDLIILSYNILEVSFQVVQFQFLISTVNLHLTSHS